MSVTLYRRSLSLNGGAGQLVRTQAEALRMAGHRVRVACRRGGLKFSLHSRLRAHYATADRLRRWLAWPNCIFLDHDACVPNADVCYIHNLLSEELIQRNAAGGVEQRQQEHRFFGTLSRHTVVVANSHAVANIIKEQLNDSERVQVQYPGYSQSRFGLPVRERHREGARSMLGLPSEAPLVGLVTSGHFEKRGLDTFLETARRLSERRSELRFLVVGSKRLPEWVKDDPLIKSGRVLYRPRDKRPERWYAAIDLFLYPARFEEFGLVVSEAVACGVPVLTSRRVGASECLPVEYEPWLLDAPDASSFAELADRLLQDDEARSLLSSAGERAIRSYDEDRYRRDTVALVDECLRAKVAAAASASRL